MEHNFPIKQKNSEPVPLMAYFVVEVTFKKRKKFSDSTLPSPFVHISWNLTKMIDYFANTYDNYLVIGNFNMEPSDSLLEAFVDSSNL